MVNSSSGAGIDEDAAIDCLLFENRTESAEPDSLKKVARPGTEIGILTLGSARITKRYTRKKKSQAWTKTVRKKESQDLAEC
jgi:hypothetical protein